MTTHESAARPKQAAPRKKAAPKKAEAMPTESPEPIEAEEQEEEEEEEEQEEQAQEEPKPQARPKRPPTNEPEPIQLDSRNVTATVFVIAASIIAATLSQLFPASRPDQPPAVTQKKDAKKDADLPACEDMENRGLPPIDCHH